MPVSRGRGGRRRPGRNSRRGRSRSGPRQIAQSAPVPGSVTEAELAAVEMIATAMGHVPAEPACPGPLLVHADGAFECHGDSCPGAMVIFHGDDVVESCAVVSTAANAARAFRATKRPNLNVASTPPPGHSLEGAARPRQADWRPGTRVM